MSRILKFDDARKRVFLDELARSGATQRALDVADICQATLDDHRKRNPEFAAQVVAARQRFTESLETEAHRRAVDGVEKPVYQNGKLVGHVKQYSDTLLLAILKKHDPSYRERVVDVNVGAGGVLVVGERPPTAEDWAAKHGADQIQPAEAARSTTAEKGSE